VTETPDRVYRFTRTMEATPAQLFRAWTDPAELGWFLNDAMPAPSDPILVDLQVGGAWSLRMVVNDDLEYVTGGIYQEIVPDSRIAFTWGAVGGWPEIDPEHPERGILVELDFREAGAGKVDHVLTMTLPASYSDDDVRKWVDMGITKGWPATVERLPFALSA
jgi:uncharacterized protein YndB with AHSA1/START domain